MLVDFWTYTCINCIRTLPYLEAWYRKYHRDGFTVVGVHTPEFPFEKEASNVQRAIGDDGLTYPVAQDNDSATWTAYHNQYWPADYLIDAQGRVRLVHFGEGSYAETEGAIRSLLAEAGGPGLGGRANVRSRDARPARHPRVLPGRGEGGPVRERRRSAPAPRAFRRCRPAGSAPTSSPTAAGGRSAASRRPPATTPASSSTSTRGGCSVCSARRPGRERCGCSSTAGRSRTRSPGRTSTAATATISSQRLYRLVDLPHAGRHLLTLRLAPGIAGYAFTFG